MRWDKKRSPEPNLYVCDENDMKRVVYNMKESIEEEIGTLKKKKEHLGKELRNQRTVLVPEKN